MISFPLTHLLSENGPLEQACRRSRQVARHGRSLLQPYDFQMLLEAFLLAESMAGSALRQALQQLPAAYRDGLTTQLEQEESHIQTFRVYAPNAPAMPIAAQRERSDVQWLTLLLVNELTGLCQFHMLMEIPLPPEFEASDANELLSAKLIRVIEDERTHIERLLSWLDPLWPKRSAAPALAFVRRFRKGLPGRMTQFFPRAALDLIRKDMVSIIDELLAQLPSEEDRSAARSPLLPKLEHSCHGQ